ncbi:MAG: hypothetical protein GQ561_03180 [Calditrichae bacterium]|nr:hypothetical protein [Calditrichia bacterium]
MEQPVAQPKPREAIILSQIQQVSNGMTGWLKFIAIMSFVYAGIVVISSWGIGLIFAWLPVWLGILLLQAANRITNARFANNQGELVQMMDKLRLFFAILGVLIIVGIVLVIIVMIVFGGLIFQYMQGGGFDTF